MWDKFRAVKMLIVLILTIVLLLVIVVDNFVRWRLEVAHNAAIDSLRQAHATTPANKISETDHIVATNWAEASTGIIEASEIPSLISAITNATRDKYACACIFDWEIRFYKGTNYLTAIQLQGRVFAFDSEPSSYTDSSGVLKNLYERLGTNSSARKNLSP